MPGVNRRSYILTKNLQTLAAGLLKHDVKNPIKTRYFCYSKNANKINLHKRKNQNIPSVFTRYTQVFTCSKSSMKTLEQGV